MSERQENLGREARRDLVYRLEGPVSEDIQQTLAIVPMRVMAQDWPAEAQQAFTELR